MQIVSFDYGLKKIGVAVGQTKTRTSSPLDIIFNKNNKINWNSIQSIVSEWRPELILVGKPLNMDGTDSDICLLYTSPSPRDAHESRMPSSA